jgi:hypothetical protein
MLDEDDEHCEVGNICRYLGKSGHCDDEHSEVGNICRYLGRSGHGAGMSIRIQVTDKTSTVEGGG